MKSTNYFSFAIKSILLTAFLILILNFACANGGGVEILHWFGVVNESEIEVRSNILKGVSLMQTIIKTVAALGGICFCWFIYKGFKVRHQLEHLA